jgi:small subunit ribosomal protein S6
VSEDSVNAYEGLFLFPQSKIGQLQSAVEHVEEILTRAEAEIIGLRKWDERRLAYEIRGNKRGVYMLVYFRARGSALVGIERDCNLSEQLLRFMIVRADHLTVEQMEAADGRAELADEAKLRAAETEGSVAGAEGAVDREEQVEVNVESVPQDATTATEA